MKRFLFILFFLFLSNNAYSATYNWYFSQSSGNDSTGNGTESNPWQTLAKVQSQENTLQSSDIGNFYFKRGDTWTFNHTGSPSRYLSFDNAVVNINSYSTGNLPIFDGQITFTTNPLTDVPARQFYNPFISIGKSSSTIRNIEIKRTHGWGILIDCPAINCTIQGVTVSETGHSGITTSSECSNSGNLIEGCTVYNVQRLEEKDYLVGYYGGAISISGFGSVDRKPYNNTIRYCYVYNSYGEGIWNPNGITEYNVIGPSYSAGIHAPVQDWPAGTNIIRYNLIYGGYGTIYYNGMSVGIVFADDEMGGTQDNSAGESWVYGNIIVGRAEGFRIYDPNGFSVTYPYGKIRVFNNTIIDSINNNISATHPNSFADVKIYNNTSILYTASQWGHVYDDFTTDAQWVISNNHYWAATPVSVDSTWTSLMKSGDPKLPKTTGWRSLTNKSTISFSDFYPGTDNGLLGLGITLPSEFEGKTSLMTTGTNWTGTLDASAYVLQDQVNHTSYDIGGITTYVGSTMYYVKTGGNDSANGLSDATAWATIGKVNSFNFPNDSIINFRPGDTFNDANLNLSGITGTIDITIQGSDFDGRTIATNGKPKFDADVIATQYNANTELSKPGAISISNSVIPGTINNLTIKDIQFEGQTQLDKQDWIWIYRVENILIDGVDGNGYGGNSYTYGNDGIDIQYPTTSIPTSGTIRIRNCNIQNLGPNTIPTHNQGDTYAIYITTKTGGEIFIHDNIIHNINADAIQVRALYSNCVTNIYSNTFYDCGENAVDIKSSDNLNVYNNNFYRTSGFVGHGGIGGTEYPLISIIPSEELAIHKVSDNNKIYGNYLHNNETNIGIYIGYTVNGITCSNNQIYNNYITDTNQGIYFGTAAIGTKVYSNVIRNSATSAYYENNNQAGNVVYNNTFVNNANMGRIISLDYSNTTIRNNVFYQTDSGDLILYKNSGSPIINNNIYYNTTTGDQNIISFSGVTYTEAQQTTWRAASGGHANEIFGDPGLSNVASNQFWAASALSSIVNTGASATGQLWDTGLKNTSTWTPNISLFTSLGTSNGGRDIGAYEFSGSTYYVKNGGSDSANGLSDETAWATIAKVNSFATSPKFTSGDIIQFKRGSTWSNDQTLGYTGSIVNWGTIDGLTIQDYGTGNLPRFNTNTQQAIYINSSTVSNLTIKNIDISGMDWTSGIFTTASHILLDGGITNVVIDGVYADGHIGASVYRRHDGFIGMYIVNGNITVKNCTLKNAYKDTFANTRSSWGSGDFPGFIIYYLNNGLPKLAGTINIYNNNINKVYSDCLAVEGVQTTTNIYNNTLTEFGENAVDSKAGRYHNIHDNIVAWDAFGHSAGSDYYGAVAFTGVSASAWAAYPVKDLTYDSNTISGGSIGFYVNSSSGSSITNNYFKDLYTGIINESAGWTISGNVFEFTEPLVTGDSAQPALNATAYHAAISNRLTITDTSITNNYILVSSTNHLYGIYWDGSTGQTGQSITGNKIRMTRDSSSVYPLYIADSYMPATLDSNNYYGQHARRTYLNGTAYTDQTVWRAVSGVGDNEIFTATGAIVPSTEIIALDAYPTLYSISPRIAPQQAGTINLEVSNLGVGAIVWNSSVISGGDWLSVISEDIGINDMSQPVCSFDFNTGASRSGIVRLISTGAKNSPLDVTIIQDPIASYLPSAPTLFRIQKGMP